MRTALLLVASAASISGAAAQNLLVNGSFEKVTRSLSALEETNRLAVCDALDLASWQVPPTEDLDLFIRNLLTVTPHCRSAVRLPHDFPISGFRFGSIVQDYPQPTLTATFGVFSPTELLFMTRAAHEYDPANPSGSMGFCLNIVDDVRGPIASPYVLMPTPGPTGPTSPRFWDRVVFAASSTSNTLTSGELTISPCKFPTFIDDVYLMPLYHYDEACSDTGIGLTGYAVSNGNWSSGTLFSLNETSLGCSEETMLIESNDCEVADCDIQPCIGSLYFVDRRGAAPGVAASFRIRKNDNRPVEALVEFYDWTLQRWTTGSTSPFFNPQIVTVSTTWTTHTVTLPANPASFVKVSPSGATLILARLQFSSCFRIQCQAIYPAPNYTPSSCDGWGVEIDHARVH